MQHLEQRQLFITNPSRSIVLKKSVDFIFKFPGQFHNFRDAGTKYQNRDCPGQSETYGMYDSPLGLIELW